LGINQRPQKFHGLSNYACLHQLEDLEYRDNNIEPLVKQL